MLVHADYSCVFAAGWSESGRCTDGHDIECQWQMNPHGNVEVSQRGVTVWVVEEGPAGAVKKILLLTTKAANSWKYVGQMLQYPSEMRGLVASVTRYDENDNEITKGVPARVCSSQAIASDWLILYRGGGGWVGASEAGWVGLSGFSRFREKCRYPPRGGVSAFLGGWVGC